MRATYISALIVGAIVVLWLVSGQFGEEPETPARNIAEQNLRNDLMQEERPLTKVRVATIHASQQPRMVSVRGKTQSKRMVIVPSQIDGLLEDRPVERGQVVKSGELLCRISVESRAASLAEAEAAVDQAEIEYRGSQKLSLQGLQSETVIAQTKARLAAAQANLDRAKLSISRLEITAPFDGVVEDVHLEKGQHVTSGSPCVTLVDLDPMLLVGQVTESELPFLKVGRPVTAVLATGEEVAGNVSFVARSADESTRTYAIEIKVANGDGLISSGVSAQIQVLVEMVKAQKISPALLVLDDEGRLGVRILDSENVVLFNQVKTVRDETDGVWVTGLPEVAKVIVVGQQLVVAGEKVDAEHGSVSLVSVDEPRDEAL